MLFSQVTMIQGRVTLRASDETRLDFSKESTPSSDDSLWCEVDNLMSTLPNTSTPRYQADLNIPDNTGSTAGSTFNLAPIHL